MLVWAFLLSLNIVIIFTIVEVYIFKQSKVFLSNPNTEFG